MSVRLINPFLADEQDMYLAYSWARPSDQALVNSTASRFRPSGFDPSRMERCDFCGCNRHSCACPGPDYEDIRDIILMGHAS